MLGFGWWGWSWKGADAGGKQPGVWPRTQLTQRYFFISGEQYCLCGSICFTKLKGRPTKSLQDWPPVPNSVTIPLCCLVESGLYLYCRRQGSRKVSHSDSKSQLSVVNLGGFTCSSHHRQTFCLHVYDQHRGISYTCKYLRFLF